jgi:hypothetical protein
MDGNRARALLGVPAHASTDAVRRAFRAVARSAHPDHGGDGALFRSLVEARTVLLAVSPIGPRADAGAWAAHLRPPQVPMLDLVDVARQRPAASAAPAPPCFDDVLAAVLAA